MLVSLSFIAERCNIFEMSNERIVMNASHAEEMQAKV
jgi:hypothetical protein